MRCKRSDRIDPERGGGRIKEEQIPGGGAEGRCGKGAWKGGASVTERGNGRETVKRGVWQVGTVDVEAEDEATEPRRGGAEGQRHCEASERAREEGGRAGKGKGPERRGVGCVRRARRAGAQDGERTRWPGWARKTTQSARA